MRNSLAFDNLRGPPRTDPRSSLPTLPTSIARAAPRALVVLLLRLWLVLLALRTITINEVICSARAARICAILCALVTGNGAGAAMVYEWRRPCCVGWVGLVVAAAVPETGIMDLTHFDVCVVLSLAWFDWVFRKKKKK